MYMEQDSNNNNAPNIPNLKDTDLFKFFNKFKFSIIGLLIIGLFFYNALFQVDTSEDAVILRLGKYYDTKGPGLHFKIPIIDTYELVPVREAQTLEFGFADFDEGRDQGMSESDEIVSLMMTNNPSIMEVIWNVQYRITDPKAYLFNVVDVKNTIRDISEAAMRMQVGDNSFEKILNNRDELSLEDDVHAFMQNILGPSEPYTDINGNGKWDDSEPYEDINGNENWDMNYNTGITITEIKITSAKYPNDVASAFDEVFRAQKDRDISVTNASEQKIASVNKAKGEVAVFDSLLAAFNNYPEITKSIMALDTQERIFRKVKDKTIIDSNLEGVLQHLDLGGGK